MYSTISDAMLQPITRWTGIRFMLVLIQFYTFSTGVETQDIYGSVRRSKRDVGRYDGNQYGNQYKPQLRAIHNANHTIIYCSVAKPQPNADLYVTCPALGSSPMTGICYQKCQPTRPCLKSDSTDASCVPNEHNVFCEETNFSNGTISLRLKVNRKDPRLVGQWSCSHAGLESTKFEITLDKQKEIHQPIHPSEGKASPMAGAQESQSSLVNQAGSGSNFMDYINRREYIIAMITVLVLSLLLNLACLIRCQLLRVYLDATQTGTSNTDALADWLCISKATHKELSARRAPVYPRTATWGMNGSYETSSQLYPKSQSHLYLSQFPNNDINGATYIPVNTLPGTPRKNYALRLQNVDQIHNPSLFYQTESTPLLQQHGYITDPNTGTTYLQTSNAPSPNMSHRLLVMNNAAASQQMNPINSVGLDPTVPPQFAIRMQPNKGNGHVIYDEVANGTSNLLNQYSHNMVETPMTILSPPTIFQPPVTQTSPLMDNRTSIRAVHNNYEPYHDGNMSVRSSAVHMDPNQQHSQPGLPPLGVPTNGRQVTPTYARTLRSFAKENSIINEEPSSNVEIVSGEIQ